MYIKFKIIVTILKLIMEYFSNLINEWRKCVFEADMFDLKLLVECVLVIFNKLNYYTRGLYMYEV